METSVDEVPPATWALMPFAVGLLLGGLRGVGSGWAGLVVVGALIVLAATRATSVRTTCAATAAGVAAGALSAAVVALPPADDHLIRWMGDAVTAVEGTVTSSDQAEARVSLVVRVEHARSRGRDGGASGLLAITIAHARHAWPAGSRVRVVGRLRRPHNFGNPGGYDLEAALARRSIGVTMFLWDDERVELLASPPRSPLDWVGEVRSAFREHVAAQPNAAARGYLTAVLLGVTQGLDRDTRQALTRTGLAHVISVSGFHIAVAAGACFFLIRWLGLRIGALALRVDVTKLAAVLGVLPVGAYAAVAGGSIPAARAFLMYGVVLGALLGDRPPDVLRALALAAMLLAVPVPDIAADVSFELSFVSVAALVLVARGGDDLATDASGKGGVPASPPTKAASWWRSFVLQPLYVSLAATVATAPLTAWHFQQVSLIAPVANLLALPLLGPATLLPGLAALPLLGVAPQLADALLAVAGRAADLGLTLAVRLAAVPWAAVATPMPSLGELALCYAALALWWLRSTAARDSPPCARGRRVAIAIVVILSTADVGFWIWERWGNPHLRVTFLSIGQGDAAVVELPYGGAFVVDGGGFAGDFDPGERLIAPFLRSRKILRLDTVVLSHPQLDHYGGLAYLVAHFRPREFWSNGARASAARFAQLEAALRTTETRSIVMRRGVRRQFAAGVAVEVLHPPSLTGANVNDASLVLRVLHGSTAVLFTGDVERLAELQMLADGVALRSDVLKVPHHGSRTSTTASWLAAVAPTVAIVSSGAENRFGFPAPEVLRRLHASGASVWNTATSGAVRVVSDGHRISVVATRAHGSERFEFPTSLW